MNQMEIHFWPQVTKSCRQWEQWLHTPRLCGRWQRLTKGMDLRLSNLQGALGIITTQTTHLLLKAQGKNSKFDHKSMIPMSMFISDGSTEHTCLHCLCTVDGQKFINSVCMAASICFHKCNQLFSATHYQISLLLNGEAKALAIERCCSPCSLSYSLVDHKDAN